MATLRPRGAAGLLAFGDSRLAVTRKLMRRKTQRAILEARAARQAALEENQAHWLRVELEPVPEGGAPSAGGGRVPQQEDPIARRRRLLREQPAIRLPQRKDGPSPMAKSSAAQRREQRRRAFEHKPSWVRPAKKEEGEEGGDGEASPPASLKPAGAPPGQAAARRASRKRLSAVGHQLLTQYALTTTPTSAA